MYKLAIGLAVLIALLVAALVFWPGETQAPTGEIPGDPTAGLNNEEYATKDDLIRVTSPAINAELASPVIITGEARGMWYFEASFPIEIRDSSNTVVGQGIATAQGEWMTEEYVPFNATIVITGTPASGSAGTVVFIKDNPSGLPEHDNSLSVPITFE